MAVARPSHLLYPSPLRYPGGKGKLANYIKLVMLTNGLVGSEYVEPYAGGAAVALSLLFEEYADHVHINDVNRSVASFWRAALNRTDEFCARIEAVKLDVSEWDRQREIQRHPHPDDLDLAFSTFFMNRTNRSGIINGGIIGGRDQSGTWQIDARWRPKDLVDRIQKIGRFRDRITVTAMDAEDYLRDILPKLTRPFLYLDPPYYGKGRRLYQDFYEHDDHARIAESVLCLKQPWIVSYDATAEIEALYRPVEQVSYGLNYTARHRFVGSELMFFQQDLAIPDFQSPTSVSAELIDAARRTAN